MADFDKTSSTGETPKDKKNDNAFISTLKKTWMFVTSVLRGSLSLISTWLVVLFLITGVAWLLVLSRGGFMQYAPVIARHSKGWDIFLNGVADTFVLLTDGFIAVVHVIAKAIRVFGGHTNIDTGAMRHYKKLPHFTAKELRQTLLNYTHTCANVTSAADLLALSTSLAVGDYYCPVLRASYPLGLPGELLRNSSEWASPPSDPTGGNCHRVPGGPGVECVALGAGFIMLDIFFPIMFLFLVLGVQGTERAFKVIVSVFMLPVKIVTVLFPNIWKKIIEPVASKIVKISTRVSHAITFRRQRTLV